MNKLPDDAPETIQTIALINDHILKLRRGPDDNVLHVMAPGGHVGLSIIISSAGIALNVSGTALTLTTTGALSIEAEHLALHGRRGFAITSGGDAELTSLGDMNTEARAQNIHARLGNVNITANDDVKLAGERIRLNT